MSEPAERALPILAGVMGWPIAQSRSPVIHGFWLEKLGIDGHYVRVPVPPGAADKALRGMVAMGFAGLQATMPHKRPCFEAVDHHTPAARKLGVVNTIVVEADGSLTGENTDFAGFLEPLAGLDLTGEAVTVLGAGGAASAVIAALAGLGASRLTLINRSLDVAHKLLETLADSLGSCDVMVAGWDSAQRHADESRLVANASALGMGGMPPMPLGVASLRADAVVYDIVTHPHETPLLKAARARGLRVHDGLEMLVGQAREAFRRFYGAEPPAEHDPELRARLLA